MYYDKSLFDDYEEDPQMVEDKDVDMDDAYATTKFLGVKPEDLRDEEYRAGYVKWLAQNS